MRAFHPTQPHTTQHALHTIVTFVTTYVAIEHRICETRLFLARSGWASDGAWGTNSPYNSEKCGEKYGGESDLTTASSGGTDRRGTGRRGAENTILRAQTQNFKFLRFTDLYPHLGQKCQICTHIWEFPNDRRVFFFFEFFFPKVLAAIITFEVDIGYDMGFLIFRRSKKI